MFFFNRNVSHVDILQIENFKHFFVEDQAIKQIYNNYLSLDPGDFLNKTKMSMQIYRLLDSGVLKNKLQKRINYLRCIQYLYNKNIILKNSQKIYNENFVNNYFYEVLHKDQINLKNSVYTNPSKTCIFGNFFLEIIDPSHRVLNKHKLEWEENKDGEDFFVYLERFASKEDEVIMNFFNDEELLSNKVFIVDGKLAYKKNNVLSFIDNHNVNDKKLLFTIDTSYNFYCYYETETYHHISSTKGKPVLAAGDIVVNGGNITNLNIDTGHYLIKDTSLNSIINIFNNLKIRMPQDLAILYFTEKNDKLTTTLNRIV